MSDGLDIDLLRRKLEGRFGLTLEATEEVIDGGRFDVIRPSDLEAGNGFGIVVSRTHRQIEASFKADNFAGALLRKMSEANAEAMAQFGRVRDAAISAGAQIYVSINGNAIADLVEMSESWRRIDLDICQRLPGGKLQPVQVLECALSLASTCLSLALSLLPLEDSDNGNSLFESGLPEGALVRVEVNRYERSPVNRAACIAHYGACCLVCGFDFSRFYGDLGEGYIEVHHRTPVSQMVEGYRVNPVTDLVPVCGNCHAMLHRIDPPMPVEKLKSIIDEVRRNLADSH